MAAEFHPPPWGAPLDTDAAIAAIPASSTVKGLFLLPMVQAAQRAGVKLEGARDRYLPFVDYPMVEHASLLVCASRVLFPSVSTREALRKLGRGGHKAFLGTTVGRVLWANSADALTTLEVVAKSYAVTQPSARVAIEERGEKHARVSFDGVYSFLDSHHVGVFEGALRAIGVEAQILLRLETPSQGEFAITWG